MAGLQVGTVKNGQVIGGLGVELGSLDVVEMEVRSHSVLR